MLRKEDKAKILDRLRQCEHFLHKRKFKTIPANYGQLKEAALLLELRHEVQKLTELFTADVANEELIKSAFLKLCAQREEQNQATCMSYTAIPEGTCNLLYLDIAVTLFKPRHFGELIAILLPGTRANLTVELGFSQTLQTSTTSPKGEENLAMTLKEEPLDAFAAYPAQWSMLTQVVTGDHLVFNVDAIGNLPLLLREQFHRLLLNYPALKNKIYKHNDDLQQLWFDLELLNKNGATPEEMLLHLSNELSRAGSHYTGNVHAANSVTAPCAQFRHYLDQLPSGLKEKLLVLRAIDGQHSLGSVLEHLANGNCVEEAAARLKSMLQNPANKEILKNHPGTTKDQEDKIKQRYRKAIEIIGYESTNKLPEKLKQELIRNIKITSAYDFIDLLLNLPPEEYLSFLTHAAITHSPPLPSELDSALNMLNTEQTTAFFDALLAQKDKFGGIKAIVFLAVKCKIKSVFEKVFAAAPGYERESLIGETNGDNTSLLALAAQNSNPEIWKTLWAQLSYNGRSYMLRRRNNSNITLLHCAASSNNPEVLRTILEFLPDEERLALLENNSSGTASPLDLAIQNSNPALFLTIRQSLSEKDYLKVITAVDTLNKVINSDNPENLRSLIAYLQQHYLYVLMRKSGSNKNILHTVAKCGNREMARIILDALPEQERKKLLGEKDESGNTPLSIAALFFSSNIYIIMMEYLTEEERFTSLSDGNTIHQLNEMAKAAPEQWSRVWGLFQEKNKFASLFIAPGDGCQVCPMHCAAANRHPEIWHDLWGALTADQLSVFVKRRVYTRNSLNLSQFLALQGHFNAWSDVWALHSESERLAALTEKSAEGDTILHYAAGNNNLEVTHFILQFLSAKNLFTALNIQKDNGITPFHMAINNSNSRSLFALLECIPAKERLAALKQKDEGDDSILHRAVYNADCLRVIWQLLPAEDRLSALKLISKYQESPLHVAIRVSSSVTVTNIILSSLSQQERMLLLRETNSEGYTPIYLALQQDEVWSVVWKYMPEPLRLFEIKEKKHGGTLLHWAASKNKPAMVVAILKILPAQDRLAALTALNEEGTTPLHIAAGHNSEMLSSMLEYLPEKDHLTAIRMKKNDGDTVLHISAQYCVNSFFVLLQALPDGVRLAALEETNKAGLSPLNAAIKTNQALFTKINELLPLKEIVRLLKIRDVKGNNSLHTASMYPQLFLKILNMMPENERLLILNEKNQSGDTPLHSITGWWTETNAWPELWKLFTDKNKFASLFAEQKNNQDICPLNCAVKYSNAAMWRNLWGALTVNQQKAVVREKTRHGTLLLHIAAHSACFEVWSEVRACHSEQERQAAFAEKSVNGWTILHWAAHNQDLKVTHDILQFLSENKLLTMLTAKTNDGNTPLYNAILHYNSQLLAVLLELIPPQERLTVLKQHNEAGIAPLQLAAGMSYPDCWEVILRSLSAHDRSSALMEKNKSGHSFFHLIVMKSAFSPDLFIRSWNLLSEEQRLKVINEKDSFGNNLLHYNASPEILRTIWKSLPQQSCLQALMARNQFGNTPLHSAAKRNPNTLTAMQASIPMRQLPVFLNERNNRGDTPLHVAARNNDKLINLRFMLASLSPPDRLPALKAKNRAGSSLLHCAAEDRNEFTIENMVALLTKDERLLLLSEKNKFGHTPFYSAANNRNFKVWKRLWELLTPEEQEFARKNLNQPSIRPL